MQTSGNVSHSEEQRVPMKVKNHDEIDINCECRVPELRNVEVVECCKCKEWYHARCVSVPHSALADKNISGSAIVVASNIILSS